MVDVYSAWDSRDRYRTRMRVLETATSKSTNTSSGTWELRLFGKNNYTFYGFTTTGRVVINGVEKVDWSATRPSGSWDDGTGVVLASGTWSAKHNSDGSKVMSFSSSFSAPTSPSSYMPGSSMSNSGSITLTDFNIAPPPAPDSPPAKVAKPVVRNITATGAQVDWDAPSSDATITGYDVQVLKSTTSTTGAMFNGTHAASSTVKDVTGGTRNTTYYARVRAKSSAGTGSWSDFTSFKTLQYTVPSAPTGYSATLVTSETCYTTAPTVSDNGGMALSNLQIQVNTTQSATGAVTHTAGAYKNIFLEGLTPGTQYYYRMRVYNAASGGGWGSWGGWAGFKTLSNTPSVPTAIATDFISGSGVVVSWEAPANMRGSTLAGYQLRIATDNRFGNGLRSFAPGPDGSPFPISQLSPGTTYYVQLWAVTDKGPGAYSTPVTFTTLADATSGLYLDFGTGPQFCEVWYNDEGVWKLCEPWQNIGTVSDDWKVGVQ